MKVCWRFPKSRTSRRGLFTIFRVGLNLTRRFDGFQQVPQQVVVKEKMSNVSTQISFVYNHCIDVTFKKLKNKVRGHRLDIFLT